MRNGEQDGWIDRWIAVKTPGSGDGGEAGYVRPYVDSELLFPNSQTHGFAPSPVRRREVDQARTRRTGKSSGVRSRLTRDQGALYHPGTRDASAQPRAWAGGTLQPEVPLVARDAYVLDEVGPGPITTRETPQTRTFINRPRASHARVLFLEGKLWAAGYKCTCA